MKKQLLPLTSLRFFAAFFVLLSHLSFLEESTSLSFLFVKDGFIGVTFFFILSGFILAYSYHDRFQEQKVSKKQYIINRIARIYPLHLLTFLLATPFIFKGGLNTFLQSLPNLFLLHAWIPIKDFYFTANEPSWSISTELFFYLFFPLFILAKTRTLTLLFSFLIFLQTTFLTFALAGEYTHGLFYISPFFRVSDFLIGIIAYRLFRKVPPTFQTQASFWQILSLSLLCTFLWFADHTNLALEYKFSLFYFLPMAFVIFSFAFENGILGRLLSHRVIVLLGESSFALYLIHQIVIRYLTAFNVRTQIFSPSILLLLVLILSLGSSLLLFKYFETPARKFLLAQFNGSKK